MSLNFDLAVINQYIFFYKWVNCAYVFSRRYLAFIQSAVRAAELRQFAHAAHALQPAETG